MKHKLINQTNNNSAEILLYGLIGKWLDIDVDYLVKELELLKMSGVKQLTLFVNSEGGDVFQGNALWAYLNRSQFNITWVVDGVAASMMAMLLTNPKHTVICNKYSKFLYHRLDGMPRGNSDDVRSYADMMDKFEADLIDMFSNRTGIDKETVKKDYFSNTDKWLSAQEALAIKLVDEIRDGNAAIAEPTDLTNSREVYNHFSKQLTNININQNKSEMKKIAALLNLNEASAEDVIAQAVQSIIDKGATNAREISEKDKEITSLKNQLAEQNKAKVKNLVDSAITAKKFGEDMRDTYTQMATDNYAMAEKVIATMTGVASVVNQLGKDSVPDTEKEWTWDDYHKKGKLENLKASNQTRFGELYKAKYGREYKF